MLPGSTGALRRHGAGGFRLLGPSRSCNSKPQRFTRTITLRIFSGRFRPLIAGPVSARSGAPDMVQIQGRQTHHPRPEGLAALVILEPFWERPAGTQTHSRRTG